MPLTAGQIKSFEDKRRTTTTNTIRHRNEAITALKRASNALMAAVTDLENLGVPDGRDNSSHYIAEAAIQVKWAMKQLETSSDAMIGLDVNKVAPDHRPLQYSQKASARIKKVG